MKFTITRKTLLEALELADKVVERKVTIPTLAKVLIEDRLGGGLRLASTNLNEHIILDGIEASIDQSGAVLLPAGLLLSQARNLPDGPITIDVTGKSAQISAGTFASKMPLEDVRDFPERPSLPAHGATITLAAAMLRELLRQTRYAAHSGVIDSYRVPGVFFQLDPDSEAHIKLGATDGYRVAMSYRTVAEKPREKWDVILPSRSLGALEALLATLPADQGVDVAIDDTRIYFQSGGRLFVTQRIAHEIPNYTKVIPTKHATIVEIPRDAFLLALRRVQTVATQDRKAVILDMADGLLTCSVETSNGRAVETVPVLIKGPGLRIAVRLDHTAEFLALMDIEVVMAGFGNADRAMVLGPIDPGVTCVIAAMALEKQKAAA